MCQGHRCEYHNWTSPHQSVLIQTHRPVHSSPSFLPCHPLVFGPRNKILVIPSICDNFTYFHETLRVSSKTLEVEDACEQIRSFWVVSYLSLVDKLKTLHVSSKTLEVKTRKVLE
jgi:hypothetical protein